MLKSLVARLFGARALPRDMTYEQARAALESHSLAARRELAGRADAEPEMLYYLAADARADVRRKVAGNPATPHHADRILADDEDEDVRAELAVKIARLVPTLDAAEVTRARDLAVETLEKLAADQLVRVRRIVAEEIKKSDRVPAHIVQKLARDVEAAVSAPVLEYSPLLSDDDLSEIIASGAASEALAAIAKRQNLSAVVADGIVASFDVPAVAALLTNQSAQIREETLDRIVDGAEGIDAWHQPLVFRMDLSVRAVKRIATFVGFSLLSMLEKREGLDPETASELRRRVRERIEKDEFSRAAGEKNEAAARAVKEALDEGRLDDSFLMEAAGRGDRAVIAYALAARLRAPLFSVERVLAAKNGKALTALVWRAGFSMRASLKIQAFVLKLPAPELVAARNGVDFPLSETEMRWHLAFFGFEP